MDDEMLMEYIKELSPDDARQFLDKLVELNQPFAEALFAEIARIAAIQGVVRLSQ